VFAEINLLFANFKYFGHYLNLTKSRLIPTNKRLPVRFTFVLQNTAYMKQSNKIALVTGGSRGLGKDMALRLAEKGIDVLLTYNTRAQE
jgi:hypothetical protein